jgi:hypothetical protein
LWPPTRLLAFTVDEHSLGLFETAAKAANAVFDAAASERP